MTGGPPADVPRTVTELTALELAAGVVFGFDDSLARLRARKVRIPARLALEELLARALQRPPCVVSFSGGRDSSAVLALATTVARREALPDPIPVSLSFPASSTAGESDYQELVVRHLGLADWHRPQFDEELDIVGPVAADFLTRFGPSWPFNVYFHAPVLKVAAGGTVLTGIGGDQVFGGWTWERENLVVTLRRRPLPLDPARVMVSVGPRNVRRAFLALRFTESVPRTWLRPAARAAARAEFIAGAARESLSFARTVGDALWRRRARVLGLRALGALAASMNVDCVSPFYDPGFLRALMTEQGMRGFVDRTQAMTALFGDVLPPELVRRPTKASFGDVFFTETARAFARGWAGAGVDDTIVDAAELKRIWTAPGSPPDARSFTLLQSIWLAQHRADAARDVPAT